VCLGITLYKSCSDVAEGFFLLVRVRWSSSITAYEAKSTEVRMFSYSLRERFNAGQLALFLRCAAFVIAYNSEGVPPDESKSPVHVYISMRSFAAAVASKPRSNQDNGRRVSRRGVIAEVAVSQAVLVECHEVPLPFAKVWHKSHGPTVHKKNIQASAKGITCK